MKNVLVVSGHPRLDGTARDEIAVKACGQAAHVAALVEGL